MIRKALALALVIDLAALACNSVFAQQGGQPADQGQPTPSQAAAPVPGQPSPPSPPAGPRAKDFEGLEVFGSDGQQIGRVVKTSETPNGQVKNIEVHSSGFFGFFAKVFKVPVDKATIKGGRVELAASSDQAKQWLQ